MSLSKHSNRLQELEDLANMLKDFDDSVTAEEVFYDTVPAEFMEAFGESVFSTPVDLISNEDMWSADGMKQSAKRNTP